MKKEITVSNFDPIYLEQLIPTNWDKPVILAYERVSTDEQAEQGNSIPLQREKISDFVNKKFPDGYLLMHFSDPAFSGTLHYEKTRGSDKPIRPGLRAITQLISGGRVSLVVIYRADRLARNPRVWYDFCEDYLKRFKVGLLATEEDVDLDNPGGELMAGVLMATGKFERDQIVGRSKDGTDKRRKEGFLLGSPPYGWQRVPAVYGPNKRRPTICQDPNQAPIVKRIYREYLAGYSMEEIARNLNRDQVPTCFRASGGWASGVVRRILSNRTHAGLMLDLAGNVVKGLHYPDRLVDPETYYLVEARRKSRAKVPTKMKSRLNQAYGHVITCSNCGHLLGTRRGCYYCRKCGWKTWTPIEGTDSFIELSLVRLSTAPAMRNRVLERIQAAASSDLDSERGERSSVVALLAENRAATLRWAKRLDSGAILPENAKIVEEGLVGERADLTRRLQELDDVLERQDSSRTLVRSALSRLEKAGNLFSTLDIREKRELALVLDVRADISVVPGGTVLGVTILGGDRREQVFEHGSAPKTWKPSDALLAVARGLHEGLSARGIAAARKVDYRSVKQQIQAIRQLGGGSLESGLASLVPAASHVDVSTGGRRPRRMQITKFEIRVLEEQALGFRHWEVAARLGISECAVNAARSRVNRKLGTKGWQTIIEARRRGLIPGPRSACKITAQEQFTLEKLAQRAKTGEIAKDLNLGREAFKSLLKRLRRKLGARNLCELVEVAIRKGLVNP